jgi:hypothetical protein
MTKRINQCKEVGWWIGKHAQYWSFRRAANSTATPLLNDGRHAKRLHDTSNQISETENQSGRTKGFFLEGQENCIEKFKIFEIIVNHVIEFHPLK